LLVYAWDDHTFGSHYPQQHAADDNPNGEWPYEPEIDAEKELMDLAETHWHKFLFSE
jgi:hypothetical protein